MGLIGLLISVILMILAAGYFLFVGPKSAFTVTNDTPFSTVIEGLSRYEDIKSQALDAKGLAEEKAADISQQMTDNPPAGEADSRQETVSDKQPAENGQQGAGELNIVDRLMQSGFTEKKSRTIDTIVLHSSYDLLGADKYSVSGIVKEYEEYGVSAHYLIDREGVIYRLVKDKNIAYHAGVSKMPDGRTDVNDFSIGIEMMNTETGQFTKAQYAAVNGLVALLQKQHPIKSVVSHADIAPGRKTDPWNFDWKKLNS